MTINAGYVENTRIVQAMTSVSSLVTILKPQRASKTTTLVTMTSLKCNAALFRYVAKMAAIEYKKCTSIHTSRFDRFEYTIRVLSVHLFSPDLNWNVLRTQTKTSKYG